MIPCLFELLIQSSFEAMVAPVESSPLEEGIRQHFGQRYRGSNAAHDHLLRMRSGDNKTADQNIISCPDAEAG